MEEKQKGNAVLQMILAAMTGAVAGGAATVPAAAIVQIFTMGEGAMAPLVLACAAVAGGAAGIVWRKLRGRAPIFSRAVVGILTQGIMLLTGFVATGAMAFTPWLIADTAAAVAGAVASGLFSIRQKSSSLDRIRHSSRLRSGNIR